MAKILPIKIFSCPSLRETSRDLAASELAQAEIKKLIADMEKTMKEKDGAGLAAPQVGRNLKIIVINTQDGTLALVNPKILKKSWKKEVMEEGCLSLPEVFGLVKRSAKVRVIGLSPDGTKIYFTAAGFLARVLQHEIDHLSGILFIDKAKEITQGKDILEKYKSQITNG